MNFGRSAAATGMVFLITASSVCAQGPQVPIPQIASEVPGVFGDQPEWRSIPSVASGASVAFVSTVTYCVIGPI